MSATGTRDIRSPSLPYKRDKDHSEKWSYGARPLHGIRVNYNTTSMEEELTGGTETSREKVRPQRSWYGQPPTFGGTANVRRTSEHKSHANKTSKPSGVTTSNSGRAGGRVSSKNDAIVDANEAAISQLSKSLLELLPQHANNTSSSIQTAIRERQWSDGEILYSFDNKGPSPDTKGREVGLGGLIDLAEKKWDSKITDKIVKSDYEVLDNSGETTTLSKKNKKSPKQKAKSTAALPEEDDGFELI